jgi:hypothetical protein
MKFGEFGFTERTGLKTAPCRVDHTRNGPFVNLLFITIHYYSLLFITIHYYSLLFITIKHVYEGPIDGMDHL